MPTLNGFETTERVRESDLVYRLTNIAVGMDNFIAKPVRVQTIRDAIAKWAVGPRVALKSNR